MNHTPGTNMQILCTAIEPACFTHLRHSDIFPCVCQPRQEDCWAGAFIAVALPPPTGQSTAAAAANPDGQMNFGCFNEHFAPQHDLNSQNSQHD